MRAFAQAQSAGSTSRENGNTFSFGAFAAMLVCAAAFLGIGAPAASAAPEAQLGWSYQRSFGESGTNYESPRNPVVVDGAGNVITSMAPEGGYRIYAADGSLLSAPGGNGLVRNLALDPNDDTLYMDEIAVFGGTTVTRWVSDGNPSPTYTKDPTFEVPQGEGIAVDPTTQDLLVADPGAEAIRRYDTAGTLVATISTPSVAPAWIATAADGSFYAAPAEGPVITHFSGAGTELGTISGVGGLHGLAFDMTDEVVVASVDDSLKTYSPTGQFLSGTPGKTETFGLAFDGGSGLLFERTLSQINLYRPATVPGVEAPVVTVVGFDGAELSAEVAPGAGPPEGSVAHFEYSADGGGSWKSTPDQALAGKEEIEADLEGLTLNTEYLVRVRASNSLASNTSGAVSFATPEVAPVVETGVASDLSETSAVLHGTVNPAGFQTGYRFEYGTTTAYGNRVPLSAEAPAGNNRVPVSVSKLITGLQLGVTYHYRLVAENAIGETAGDDRTFTTLTADELFPQRAYEQVTPVDKEGAQVLSDFHTQTAEDGSGIAVTTVQAPSGAPSSMILQNQLSRRGTDGWLDWTSTDAPQDSMPGLNEASTTAISADFEHALVISNRVLDAGGIAGGGNLYVKDLLTGDYTFVAGAPGAGAWNAMTGLQSNEKVFIAGAPDFSWIYFFGRPSFLPGAPEFAIYRWTRAAGDLQLESRLPGEIVPFFSAQEADGYKRELPAVSSDGSVLGYGLNSGVYRREGGETKPVSASQIPDDPAGTEAQPAVFDGMTPDGRYIFFRSGSRLTEDASEASLTFLYRYDALTEKLEFLMPSGGSTVAVYGFSQDGQTVYNDDETQTLVWHAGQVRTVTTDRPAQVTAGSATAVSPNGRYFSWLDEVGAAHLYDLDADEASCVSCPPGGGSGEGARFLAIGRSIGNREVQAVIDDGTMFFDTPKRLLDADHNGARDVYAYRDGRLDLISPGNDGFDAFFVDASLDGSDVFFQTDQGLVGQDTDGESDVYDARVGGGFASQNPPPPPGSCAGAECVQAGGKPAASPPMATTGAANPATPHKKHKHKNRKHKGKKHKKKGQKGKRHSARSSAANDSKNLGE